MSSLVESAEPFSPEETATRLDQFHRDGFLFLPGVLTDREVAGLRDRIDGAFANENLRETDHRYGDYIMVRMFELDPMFQDMLTREPILSLVEAVLGPDCHLIAQNVVRNAPGQALDRFHADDLVYFPVAADMSRHDPRLRMPVFIMTVQILLSEVPAVEYGPTQYVPTSHYSGRQPEDPFNPTFEGHGAVSMLGKAGDLYLHNGQCWHRGHPNDSDQTRYLLQLAFGQRWVAQRFYPFLNYRMPEHVIDRASERCLRVLGKHPKGAYG